MVRHRGARGHRQRSRNSLGDRTHTMARAETRTFAHAIGIRGVASPHGHGIPGRFPRQNAPKWW